jgi:hypothetical protein
MYSAVYSIYPHIDRYGAYSRLYAGCACVWYIYIVIKHKMEVQYAIRKIRQRRDGDGDDRRFTSSLREYDHSQPAS